MATLNRTRAWIEGDLKAAKREVERLQAELAAVQPDKLVIHNLFGDAELRLKLPKTWCHAVEIRGVRHGVETHVGGFEPDALGQLRDWLNYHFPKEARC